SGNSQLVQQDSDPILSISLPAEPWAYGAAVRIDGTELFSGRQSIVVELGPVADTFGVGILNKLEDRFLARSEAPASAVPVELWLPVDDPADISAVVIQNWAEPSRTTTQLRAVWIVAHSEASLHPANGSPEPPRASRA